MKNIIRIIILTLLLMTGCMTTSKPESDQEDDIKTEQNSETKSNTQEDPDLSEPVETEQAGNENSENGSTETQNNESTGEEDSMDSEDLVLTELTELVKDENLTAEGLGIFLRENKALLSSSDLEAALEKLLLLQQVIINDMHTKIYNETYMSALNNSMGGILDISLIDSIPDEVARKDFQAMADSYLTIVRYEETPVAEADYKALSEFKPYVSLDFSKMLYLNEALQTGEYGRGDIDVKKLTEDILLAEELIRIHEMSFLSWQLERLYSRQISQLLVGPEGSYIQTFMNKNDLLYSELIMFADAHSDSKLGRLIVALDNLEQPDFMKINDTILYFNMFGVNSNFVVTPERLDGGTALSGISYLHIPNESDKEKALNDKINELVAALTADEKADYNSYYLYGNKRFLNLILSSSYIDGDGSFHYISQAVLFDMDTLEPVTLLGLLPDDAAANIINRLTGGAVNDITDLQFGYDGLTIGWKADNDPYGSYGTISYSELSRYMDISIFYK